MKARLTMKLLMKNMRYFVRGVTIGSTLYLLIIASGYQSTQPTVKNILSVMLMSGLIGLLSQIFEIESLSYSVVLIGHLIITFTLVSAMMAYNGWLDQWQMPQFWMSYLLEFVIVYGLAWVIIYLTITTKIRRINQALKKRNLDKK